RAQNRPRLRGEVHSGGPEGGLPPRYGTRAARAWPFPHAGFPSFTRFFIINGIGAMKVALRLEFAWKKNGDLEKNPLWQGFSSGLLSSVVPEDLEFRAQVCSPWTEDGGKL